MISRLSRALRRFLALDRRYGVRHSGGIERTGMYSRREAEGWLLRRAQLVGIVYHYDPIDLRMVGAEKAERESFRP
jgi:hypothetical protein